MKSETQHLTNARMVPLLRSIAREIRERNGRIAELEMRSAELADKHLLSTQQFAQVQSELALHTRELRRAEKELEGLGWSLDPDRALRLVCRNGKGVEKLTWAPESTGFYPLVAGA